MISEIEKDCETFCNGEELVVPHQIKINLKDGKVDSDVVLDGEVYNYTRFKIKDNDYEISSLTFLPIDELIDLRMKLGYIEDDNETDYDSNKEIED